VQKTTMTLNKDGRYVLRHVFPVLGNWYQQTVRCPLETLSTTNYTPRSKVLQKVKQFLNWSRNSLHFTEPQGSLTHSQEPATYPYPAPDQSISSPLHFSWISIFNIILSSTPRFSKSSLSHRLPLYAPLLSLQLAGSS
jgi:hypothetical protein